MIIYTDDINFSIIIANNQVFTLSNIFNLKLYLGFCFLLKCVCACACVHVCVWVCACMCMGVCMLMAVCVCVRGGGGGWHARMYIHTLFTCTRLI